MIDIELEDGRLQPAKRQAAGKPRQKRSPPVNPQEQRWRFGNPATVKVHEAALHEQLEKTFQSLCKLDWCEAYEHAQGVGEIWADLPAMVRFTIEPEFPFHPDHLQEGATEAWIVYAIWHALWWRHQVPGIEYTETERPYLRYDARDVNPVPCPF